jgi:tetratricopeptide (TPR) repeat protein
MSGSRPQGPKSAGGKGNPRTRTANRTPIRPSAGSSSLYERYKDALRRGHVAALRGRNDAAIEAYQEAASIAPDRALPHASIGGILVKLNRPADAVASYERALALAPRDETALRGLAETLTRLGRRPAAADALDRLATTLETAGRTADATDAARRSLELAETPERRTRVESLADRLRTVSPGDEAAERALSQALRVLEPVAVEPVAAAPVVEAIETPEVEAPEVETQKVEPAPVQDVPAIEAPVVEAPAAEAVEAPAEAVEAPAEVVEAQLETLEASAEPAGVAESPNVVEVESEPEPEPASIELTEAEPAAVEPEPEPESEVAEPIGLGIALGAVAETHLYAGELEDAHAGLLAAARAHRRAGRLVAAIDACYLAIGLAPSDPDLHLLLSELYLDRGWRTMAADKLLLLGRIAELDADAATRDRLCELVATRLADEPRVAELCA